VQNPHRRHFRICAIAQLRNCQVPLALQLTPGAKGVHALIAFGRCLGRDCSEAGGCDTLLLLSMEADS
jgi:hypothetical protein